MMDPLQLTERLLPPAQGAALRRASQAASSAASGESPGVGDALQNFGGMLRNELDRINQLQTQSDQAKQTYASGGEVELHQVVLAAEKADLSLQLAMQIRNKIISAYQEISHMPV